MTGPRLSYQCLYWSLPHDERGGELHEREVSTQMIAPTRSMTDLGQTVLVRTGDIVLHRGHPRSAPLACSRSEGVRGTGEAAEAIARRALNYSALR
jgi:hypothetical protein